MHLFDSAQTSFSNVDYVVKKLSRCTITALLTKDYDLYEYVFRGFILRMIVYVSLHACMYNVSNFNGFFYIRSPKINVQFIVLGQPK